MQRTSYGGAARGARAKEMSFDHVARAVPTYAALDGGMTMDMGMGMGMEMNMNMNMSVGMGMGMGVGMSMDMDMGLSMGLATRATLPAKLTATSRTCYSPLSVGQLPSVAAAATARGSAYDQLGFAWHWISEVCTHFALQRQTAHFAIQYVHRVLRQRASAQDSLHAYLQHHYDDLLSVQKELQMLGLVCVFIAAKIEEVHPPKAAELAQYITDHGAVACAAEDVIQHETLYLVELKWSLHPTTVLSWLLFLLAGDSSDQQPAETMGEFVNSRVAPSLRKDVFITAANLIDVALLDSQAMDFLPSVLAGSAILLADPALDLMFVAQFMQLEPTLLWECKSWLFVATNGLSELSNDGTRDPDRWSKVPEEEFLFIQGRVPVPSHLAYGLLRVENSSYDYVALSPSHPLEPTTPNTSPAGYQGYPSYASANCVSPSTCDTYGCYCGPSDSYSPHNGVESSEPPPVYHFKYGWQGAEPGMGYDAPSVQRKLQFS